MDSICRLVFVGRSTRRVLAAVLAAGLLLAPAGCGGDDDEDSTTTEPTEAGQFTTAALEETLQVVRGDAGAEAKLLQLQMTVGGTDYQLREGKQARGLHFDVGSTEPQQVDVGATDQKPFPISQVQPEAIDKMVAAAPEASGADDFTVSVITLQRNFTTGELEWTINGDGGGRTGIVLTAKPDGSGLSGAEERPPPPPPPTSGGGPPPEGQPPQAPEGPTRQQIQDLAKCLQEAGGDPAKIQACSTELQQQTRP